MNSLLFPIRQKEARWPPFLWVLLRGLPLSLKPKRSYLLLDGLAPIGGVLIRSGDLGHMTGRIRRGQQETADGF